MSDNAGAKMTDEQKQIAWEAFMNSPALTTEGNVIHACEAVIASRAPRDVGKAVEAAQSSPLGESEPAQEMSMPFYGNAECGKCGASLYRGCYWIEGEGETPSKMAVCPACYKFPAGAKKRSKIRTSFIYPPIPVRHFDWVAWIDGDEETGFYGNGRTETEAIDELMNLQAQLDEENQPSVIAASAQHRKGDERGKDS